MTWAIATGIAIGAIVGGGSAALQKKDILQGALIGGATGAVTGGIGSLGTSAATTGVATAGEAALTSGATDAIGSSVLNSTASPIASGLQGFAPQSALSGEGLNFVGQSPNLFSMGGGQGLVMPTPAAPGMALTPQGMGNWSGSGIGQTVASSPALTPPSSNPFFSNPMKYLGDNKMSIGLAGLAGGMAPAAGQSNTGQEETTYHPYTYSANLNPSYTGAGTSYFDQGYKKLPTYTAADGGIMSLAEGGDTAPAAPVKKEPTLADYLTATRTASANARSVEMPTMQAQYIAPQQQYTRPIQQVPQAVTDYNNTLMQRAQNEYVDSPQLGAFTSHFNDPVPLPPNADTTNMLYQKYLGRDADPAGYAANKNATSEQITYGLQSSPEYMKANPNAPAPVAPVAGPVNYTYNPATRGYMTSYAPVDPKAPVDPRAGIAALQPQPVAYNYDQGGGGGDGGAFAMGGGIGADYDNQSRFNHGPEYPMQQPQNYNSGGGIYNLGSYSDGGRLLRGPGDGVSDDIPAEIGGRQPARLADGEFVVPARIVSELGNGSTDAGAKQLYAMMDRVQSNRRKTIGNGNVAVNSRSSKYLPA
jgi:hypothetical protein